MTKYSHSYQALFSVTWCLYVTYVLVWIQQFWMVTDVRCRILRASEEKLRKLIYNKMAHFFFSSLYKYVHTNARIDMDFMLCMCECKLMAQQFAQSTPTSIVTFVAFCRICGVKKINMRVKSIKAFLEIHLKKRGNIKRQM